MFFIEFEEWGYISGASVNEDKTKILALNSEYKENKGIKFVENLKILGIIFDQNGISNTNIKNTVENIKKTIQIWSICNMNIIERMTVLKTFILSKLWYQESRDKKYKKNYT